jgi:hypothetical protein
MGTFPPGLADFSLYAKAAEHLRDAHERSYGVLKAGPGDFPVGLTVSMSDWWTPEGGEAGLERARKVTERWRVERAMPVEIPRLRLPQHGHLVTLLGENVIENGHVNGA